MDIYEKLQEAGLTGNESKVYLELLKKEKLSANQIAKNLGIDRTLTYTILNHLIEKGQVNYVVKESKKLFSCSNPDNLLNPLKAKEFLVLDLIKDLNKIKKQEQKDTEINVYEGKEGLRAYFKLIIQYKQFCSFGSTGRAYDFLYEAPAMAKEMEKKNIKSRLIMSSILKKHVIKKVKGVEIRYLNIEAEATTSIFGEYVVIHLIKGKPLVIIIKNKDIAESYRKYFEILWKTAKR